MSRLARNVGLLLLAQWVEVIAAVATVAVSARYLGVHGFGQQAVLRAIAMVAFPLLAGGIRVNVVREIARDRGSAATYVGDVLAFRWALVACAAGLSALAIPMLPLSRDLELASYATLLLVVAGIWDAVPRAIFIAYEHNEYNLAASGACAILAFLGTVLAARADAGVAGVLGAAAVAELLTAQLTLTIACRRFLRPHLRIRLREWGPIIRQSLPLGLSAVLKRAYAQVDVWLLAGLLGSSAAGIFSVAYRVTVQISGSAITVSTALLPRLALLARDSRAKLREAYERLLNLSLVLSVPAAGLLAAEAGPLVRLVAGEQFGGSAEALRLVSVAAVAALPNGLLFFTLVALDLQVRATGYLALTVALNLVLDALLIPRLGVAGACLGTSVAEWTFLLLAVFELRRTLGSGALRQRVGKPVLAAVPMLGVIWWAGPGRPVAAGLGGLAVYGLALFLLRGVPTRGLRAALTPEEKATGPRLDAVGAALEGGDAG